MRIDGRNAMKRLFWREVYSKKFRSQKNLEHIFKVFLKIDWRGSLSYFIIIEWLILVEKIWKGRLRV